MFKLVSPEAPLRLDCAGLIQAQPHRTKTKKEENPKKTQEKLITKVAEISNEQEETITEEKGKLQEIPDHPAFYVEKKHPVIWNISINSEKPMISTHFATKDSTILPWGFELEEDETLGFFSEPGMDQKVNHQALLNAKIMNQESVILADTGADLSVLHLRTVERLRLPMDTRRKTQINGLGSNSVFTLGTVPVKITIGNGLVYCLEIDVCDLGKVSFNMMLGMDFLSRAHVTVDVKCYCRMESAWNYYIDQPSINEVLYITWKLPNKHGLIRENPLLSLLELFPQISKVIVNIGFIEGKDGSPQY